MDHKVLLNMKGKITPFFKSFIAFKKLEYLGEKMIKIKLNDMALRYDVFQMFSIFYKSEDIKFVEIDEVFQIEIDENFEISIDDKGTLINAADGNHYFAFDYNFSKKENTKRAIFSYLSTVTGKEMPWGILVGIRPSKIALSLLSEGKKDEEIIDIYKEGYFTREDKARLCIQVAKLEKNIVNKDKNSISIYIGMPFCPTRCIYCSFASNPISSCSKLVEPYLAALTREIAALGKYIRDKKLKVQCIYFGGGTPTSVNDMQFDNIMMEIHQNLSSINEVEEFTVECGRPDSITREKLLAMKRYGVHRISINPQTMNDDTLRRIGRNHTAQDVIEKFNLARSIGFDNINMDLIVGLQGEGLEHIVHSCYEIDKLRPESITVHGMSIKRSSRLHENIVNKIKLEEKTQSELNKMYEATANLAEELHMKPYYMYRQKNMVGNMENVGYSNTSKECIYNIQMMEEKQTIIALGADAVSKVVFLDENRIERFANTKDVREYVSRIDEMIERKIELLNTLY